ncbi:hypothetical protein M0802_011201 [Mischocyttarus mexicanus]|nr:hypothetical protein M0802_011201 [Mischocyttarus mexicanus]
MRRGRDSTPTSARKAAAAAATVAAVAAEAGKAWLQRREWPRGDGGGGGGGASSTTVYKLVRQPVYEKIQCLERTT